MTALVSLTASAALPADYYASSSRLSLPGRWVRIKVTKNGIHRISDDQLRQWGFANPEKVHVYGYSGVELASDVLSETTPEDLPLVYSQRIDDGLYFYGLSDLRVTISPSFEVTTERNYFSPYSIYFLSDAATEEPTAVEYPYIAGTTTVNYHFAYDYQELENYNAGSAGIFYFSRPLSTNPEDGIYDFHPVDYKGNGTVVYTIAGKYSGSASTSPYIEPELSSNITRLDRGNITRLAALSESDNSLYYYSKLPLPCNFPVTLEAGSTEPFRLTFTDPGNSNLSYLGIDYACLIYERENNLADHGQIEITMHNIKDQTHLKVENVPSNVMAWNVTDARNISVLIPYVNNPFHFARFSPPAGTYARIQVFDPSSPDLLVPEFDGEVHADRADLHADREPADMLIITMTDMLPQAREIAQLHEQEQGLTVKVVDQKDIYNEFSSGAPSAIAYRRYVKFLADQPNSQLKYLLLLGQGSYDNRGLINAPENRLMTYQCYESRTNPNGWFRSYVQSFSSDNYFGMVQDDFAPTGMPFFHTQIGVGRLSFSTPSQVDLYITKIRRYYDEIKNGTWFSRATILSDYGNRNDHMSMAQDAASRIAVEQPGVNVTRLYESLYERDLEVMKTIIPDNFALGQYYWAYSGHGATGTLTSNMAINTVRTMNYPYSNHSVVMLATCSGLVHDRNTSSIGHTMITADRGPIGVVGACRSVYLNLNREIMLSFTDKLYAAEDGTRLGDVFKDAFNATVRTDSRNLALNSLCYNLEGDPALPVANIALTGRVTTVNNDEATYFNELGAPKEHTFTLDANTPINLAGEVTLADYTVDEDFNGIAMIELYNGPEVRASMAAGSDEDRDDSIDITIEEGLLAAFPVTVTNGRWSGTVTCPLPREADHAVTVVVAAIDASRNIRSISKYSGLVINDPAPSAEPLDKDAPVITEFYVDSPSFRDGDVVGNNPMLCVRVAPDPSGISLRTNPFGRGAFLSIDGKSTQQYAGSMLKLDNNGGASLDLQLNSLADGPHFATFRVYDNVGNMAERIINFTVVNGALNADLVCLDGAPRATESIKLDLTLPSGAYATRLNVEDAQGNTVRSISNPSFPYALDTTGLPEGAYKAFAILRSPNAFGRSCSLDFTVIHPE